MLDVNLFDSMRIALASPVKKKIPNKGIFTCYTEYTICGSNRVLVPNAIFRRFV